MLGKNWSIQHSRAPAQYETPGLGCRRFLPCFRKIPRREHEKDCITVGDHHCEDADQADSPSLVTCRSFDKLDDFTPLKRKSVLRGKSARRGEGIERDGQKAAAGLPWTTMTARLARFYLRCSSERPTRANLADRRHAAFYRAISTKNGPN